MSDEEDDEERAIDPVSKRGRPSLLNDDLQRLICSHILFGSTQKVAAQAAGISANTFTKWIRLGEANPDSKYGDFLRAIKSADAQAEATVGKRLYQATEKSWMASATFLKLRYGKRWKEHQKTELAGKVELKQVAPKYDYSTLSDEDLAKLVEIEEKLKAKLPESTERETVESEREEDDGEDKP